MPTGFPDYYGGLTLPVTVPEGGTGHTAVTANALLLGAGSGAMVETNVGTADQVLQIPHAGGAPQFQTITISGSAIVGIVPLANGGTGTATPALVAGTGISLSGSWPNNTITNTSAYAALADPLPVAHGGTGTATPALVAGTNITITGSWPAQTIGLTTNPLDLSSDLLLENNFHMQWHDTHGGIVQFCCQSDNNFVFTNTDSTGAGYAVFAHQGHSTGATFDFFVPLGLSTPLSPGSGGTGAASLRSALIPHTDATVLDTALAASTGPTTLITAVGLTYYLVCVMAHVHSPTGISTLAVSISWQYDGVTLTKSNVVNISTTTGDGGDGATFFVYVQDTGTVTFTTTYVSGGAGDDYDLALQAIRVGN